MHNLIWGGVETNQIGTASSSTFCAAGRRRAADVRELRSRGDPPLGRSTRWARNRPGNAQEAADWVAYCNSPEAGAHRHGARGRFRIKVWQLGNETSYAPEPVSRKTRRSRKTIEFARPCVAVDPSLKLIGWGDSGWAPDMIEQAGEHLDYARVPPPLRSRPAACRDTEFRQRPGSDVGCADGRRDNVRAQDLLEMRATRRSGISSAGADREPLSRSRGRNRCDLNRAWAAGVAFARFHNLHHRHGDVLKIANLGDFCGTRWQTNVVMLPTPGGEAT